MRRRADPNPWQRWREKLTKAAPSFNVCETSSEHLSRLFGEFCNVSGTVLDVGSGPRMAEYLKSGRPALCVGLDPLAKKESGFDFVCGVGEYLPFRSTVFDHCISGTSLDHCVRPDAFLQEMRRVTREKGQVSLWIGCWAQDGSFDQWQTKKLASQELRVRPIVGSLLQDAGEAWALFIKGEFAFLLGATGARVRKAVRPIRMLIPHKLSAKSDPYHLHHFREKDIDRLLKAVGLSVLKRRRLPDGSLFLVTIGQATQFHKHHVNRE